MKKIILTLLCISAVKITFGQSTQLKQLRNYLSGYYSSEQQHKTDTLNYFNIKLHIIPIWKERADGIWFYIEQAVEGSVNKPYRQRVYHVTEKEKNVFESAVFIFSNPLRFTGNATLFEKTLTPDSLTLREGCSVILREKNKVYEGGTEGVSCASERKGATYATASVTLTEKELHSWDRGFNDKGEQVWGATKGGYIFIKIKTY